MSEVDYRAIQVGGHHRDSQRFIALVDHADIEMVGAYRWTFRNGYAVRCTGPRGRQVTVRMHRELLGLVPGAGVHVDHVNGDKLDNRRANLRVATKAQNAQNRHWCGPYRGTYWDAPRNRWRAKVELAGKCHTLGYFATREEAAEVAAAFRAEHMPYSADARRVRDRVSGGAA